MAVVTRSPPRHHQIKKKDGHQAALPPSLDTSDIPRARLRRFDPGAADRRGSEPRTAPGATKIQNHSPPHHHYSHYPAGGLQAFAAAHLAADPDLAAIEEPLPDPPG